MTTKETNQALEFLEDLMGEKLTFGLYIKSIRQGEELNQVEFAKLLGISRQALCDIEHGRKSVSPKKAAEYADVLGYSKRQFVRLCLQDILDRDKLGLKVDIENAA